MLPWHLFVFFRIFISAKRFKENASAGRIATQPDTSKHIISSTEEEELAAMLQGQDCFSAQCLFMFKSANAFTCDGEQLKKADHAHSKFHPSQP